MKNNDLNSKDNIVRIAFALFLEKGYKEVTIRNIMEACNLSKGAIYHHFKSKEEIYFATLEAHYFNLLKTDKLEFQSGDFRQDIECLYNYIVKLFAGIEKLTEEGLNYPIRSFYVYQLKSEHIETMRNQKILAIGEFRNKVKNIVIDAIDNGQIKEGLEVDIITTHILSFIDGIAIHHSTIKMNVREELTRKYQLVFDSYLKLICN